MTALARPLAVVAAALLIPAVIGCGSAGRGGITGTGSLPDSSSLRLVPIAAGLAEPVDIASSPPDTARLFVAEKQGRIRVIRSGELLPAPFLDLRDRVKALNLEQGLLGLAFDPRYASTGRFYVFYTGLDGASHLARYRVSTDPDRALPAADRVLLSIPQSEVRHLGGALAFGPDGYLYVSVGDGAAASTVAGGTAQDLTDLRGSILRLDVSGAGDYSVPESNPFRLPSRSEIWCYGLRNPWRMSFDRQTGDLYLGDVGDGRREEIDVATAETGGGRGLNFGWRFLEGTVCIGPGCGRRDLTPPALEYSHGDDCCVIGGRVYRGESLPWLQGTYFFGDYCSSRVSSFRFAAGRAIGLARWRSLEPEGKITCFGEDAAGELYLATREGGLFRFAPR